MGASACAAIRMCVQRSAWTPSWCMVHAVCCVPYAVCHVPCAVCYMLCCMRYMLYAVCRALCMLCGDLLAWLLSLSFSYSSSSDSMAKGSWGLPSDSCPWSGCTEELCPYRGCH